VSGSIVIITRTVPSATTIETGSVQVGSPFGIWNYESKKENVFKTTQSLLNWHEIIKEFKLLNVYQVCEGNRSFFRCHHFFLKWEIHMTL
jgi:hypothetical protein